MNKKNWQTRAMNGRVHHAEHQRRTILFYHDDLSYGTICKPRLLQIPIQSQVEYIWE